MNQFKIFTSFFCFFFVLLPQSYSCHETTVTETSATDNGDGTITYVLDVCIGSEDTWGFQLDFTTSGNVVSVNTPSITDPGTTQSITPTIISATTIEFGDFDNTGNPVFHASGSGQQCFAISVTIAGGASNVNLSGSEFNFGPCANSGTMTGCLPSVSDYVIEITTDNCAGNNVSFELQDNLGNPIAGVSNILTNGTTQSWVWCGGCVDQIEVNAPASTGGAPSSRCDPGLCCVEGLGSYNVYTGGGTVPLVSSSMIGVSSETSNISACAPILLGSLLSFDAKQLGRDIQINWLARDIDAETLYEVQKSADGISFETIYSFLQVNAIAGEKEFYTLDVSPLPAKHYYRLRMKNASGVYFYSNIQLVEMKVVNDLSSIELFPNPTRNKFHFYYQLPEGQATLNVVIFDMLGKEIKRKTFGLVSPNALELIEMSVDDFENGLYVVQIGEEQNLITRTVIVAK